MASESSRNVEIWQKKMSNIYSHLPLVDRCDITLFRNKRFMLDEMTRWNASKFAIFYIYENPKLLFPFFISCNFTFIPNECHGLCCHRPWNSLGKEVKLHEMKNGKSIFGFSYTYTEYGKFRSVSPGHFIKHKPIISEECR